jgi:hypothetical protein
MVQINFFNDLDKVKYDHKHNRTLYRIYKSYDYIQQFFQYQFCKLDKFSSYLNLRKIDNYPILYLLYIDHKFVPYDILDHISNNIRLYKSNICTGRYHFPFQRQQCIFCEKLNEKLKEEVTDLDTIEFYHSLQRTIQIVFHPLLIILLNLKMNTNL